METTELSREPSDTVAHARKKGGEIRSFRPVRLHTLRVIRPLSGSDFLHFNHGFEPCHMYSILPRGRHNRIRVKVDPMVRSL